MPLSAPGFATKVLAAELMQGYSKCHRILSELFNTIIYLNDLLASINK